MSTEQEEFNRLAARAIHVVGLLGARLGLNPDDLEGKNAATIEHAFATMAKRLPVAEAELTKAREELAAERFANANLKVTLSTLRDRVKLFRDFIQGLPLEVDIGTWRDGRKELLAIHDVP